MVAPKPRDPAQPSLTPEELSQRIDDALQHPANDLADEAEQLEKAHRILSDALQNN